MLGDVVAGGAESAGGEHHAGAVERAAHRFGDVGRIVSHGGATHHPDTGIGKALPGVGGVGVDGVTEQEFVTDGDEFDRRAPGGRCSHDVERKRRRYCTT